MPDQANAAYFHHLATAIINENREYLGRSLADATTEVRRELRQMIRTMASDKGLSCTLGSAENALDSALTEYYQSGRRWHW